MDRGNMEKVAFIFPGQGSQFVGMGKSLAETYPLARETFAEADDLLGFPLSKLCFDGPEAQLNDTINTQPALFVVSMAVWRVLQEQLPQLQPAAMAGHSLGEYSALAAAGALSFAEALSLIRERGRLMKQAGEISPGGMAAILGLDTEQVEAICHQASDSQTAVQVANDNCPGQVVISGHKEAVARALPLAQEAGARRVVPLAISIAAHSPLMVPVTDEFTAVIESINFRPPVVPVVANASAAPVHNLGEMKRLLAAQLTSPVLWTESVHYLLEEGVNTFVEIGPGNVLTGLIKRIHRQSKRFSLGTAETVKAFVQSMGGRA